jgi:hypothetical protein
MAVIARDRRGIAEIGNPYRGLTRMSADREEFEPCVDGMDEMDEVDRVDEVRLRL